LKTRPDQTGGCGLQEDALASTRGNASQDWPFFTSLRCFYLGQRW